MLRRVVNVVQVIAIISAAVFVLLLFVNEPDDSSPPSVAGSDAGARVFRSVCAGCHGPDGQGGIGPRLAGGAVVRRYPQAQDQVEVVTNGRGGMPAFGRSLSAEEIRAVVDYTRTELR